MCSFARQMAVELSSGLSFLCLVLLLFLLLCVRALLARRALCVCALRAWDAIANGPRGVRAFLCASDLATDSPRHST